MATFQVQNKNKSKSAKNAKKIAGWTLLCISTFIFLFSVTNLLPFLHYFLLGSFGIFVYPLAILGLIISLALLNNKKYVMPKKYAIFLSLSLYFILAIIQLIIVGLPGTQTYGEYMALNYTKQFTAGGMFIGFLPCTLMYLMGGAGTYIILSIALVSSLAFFIEAVVSLRKTASSQKPIKIQIREKEVKKPFNPRTEKLEEDRLKNEKVFKNKTNDVGVMYEANVQAEEKKELSAREKLGLVGNYNSFEKVSNKPEKLNLPEDKDDGKIPQGMSVKDYLLHSPKIDMEKYMQNVHRTRPLPKTEQMPSTSNALEEEINKNIEELKQQEEIQPYSIVQNEDFDYSQNQSFNMGNLTEIKPEEITNEAEDIIRSVVEQEKKEREEEKEQEEGYKNFIDFDDIEPDEPARQGPEQENNYDMPRSELEDRGNRADLRERREFERRDFTERREFSRETEHRFERDIKPIDEMERRKNFVEIDSKKEEKIVPYKYTRPSLDLITTRSDDLSMFNEEIPMKRIALENALENFGVPAKVQNVVIGPTVTRYEIEMPEGISVKKVLSLDADIAYALSAKGEIRIEAPIPGRSIVGIEVPNSKVAKVSIKDVLQSKEFSLSPSPLTFALGKDITGNVKVCNLQKMPHLLVAGTTGSGKSVCLNSIITSILYKASPEEVKFIMIDPKQVELSMYEGLPHMIVPKVLTDPTKAVNALQWAVDEMERRFNLISEERVRNIDEYNKTEKVLQNKVKKMPFIVIIFDEFADFMAVAKNEIEDKIRRLAGKARAAGIHLILATQRPSTDVVTGTLKANLPARIAFKVAGRVDSEVIMGATGAEKLLGYGDMLYKPTDSAPVRIQGCFIDTPETKEIVNFITANNDEIFDEEAFNAINNPGKNSNGTNGETKDGVDPLLPQALKICIDNGVASSTMVQRKLSIGYPRAARIIDQMEERGYISSAEGSKQRSVYITIEEFYAIFGDIYD